MKIIDGKKIADKILSDLKKQIRNKKLKPCLAVILNDNNPASQLYIKQKEKAAQKVGIEIKKHSSSSIDKLNRDKQVKGILVQLPLPKGFNPDKIIKAINPEKDVDGLLPKSRFDSPFILAIYRALLETKEDLKNKKIIALVKSDVFAEKLKKFFNKQGLEIDSEVVPQKCVLCRERRFLRYDLFDIIITALGKPNFIKGSMIKQGVILIDGGISLKDKKVIGDVDVQSVSKKAKWLSPVPGGVGPLTVAFLLKNLCYTNQSLA